MWQLLNEFWYICGRCVSESALLPAICLQGIIMYTAHTNSQNASWVTAGTAHVRQIGNNQSNKALHNATATLASICLCMYAYVCVCVCKCIQM